MMLLENALNSLIIQGINEKLAGEPLKRRLETVRLMVAILEEETAPA